MRIPTDLDPKKEDEVVTPEEKPVRFGLGDDLAPAPEVDKLAPAPTVEDDMTDKEFAESSKAADDFEANQLNQNFKDATKKKKNGLSVFADFGKRHNLSPKYVEDNQDLLFSMAKEEGLDFNKINKQSPATANVLKNPTFAAIAQDDVKALTRLEENIKLISLEDDKGHLGNFVNAVETGLEQGHTGKILYQGLVTGQDKESLARDINASSQRADALRAKKPKTLLRDAARMSREQAQFMRAFRKTKKNMSIHRLDHILDDLGPNVLNMASEGLDVLASWAKSPSALIYVNAESLHTMIRPTTYGAVGAAAMGTLAIATATTLAIPLSVAGVAGGIAGAFYGSAQSEAEGSTTEQAGGKYNLSDFDSTMAMLNDQKLMGNIISKADKKGIGVALVDTGLTLVGARYMGKAFKASSLAKKARLALTGQAFEVASEGASEWAGQWYMYDFDHSKIDGMDVFDEMQGSILSGGAVVSAGAKGAWTTATTATAKISEYRKNKVVVNARKAYSKDPEKALMQMGRDKNAANQAFENYVVVDELWDSMDEVKTAKDSDALIQQFTEDAAKRSDGNGKVYYNTSKEFDYYAEENGVEASELVERMSPEGQAAYEKSKTDGSNFEMPAADFASIIATRPELRGMAKIIKVKADGVSAAQGSAAVNRANALLGLVQAEAEEVRNGKKLEKSAKAKIRKAVAAKIELAGFEKDQATMVEALINQFVGHSSNMLGTTAEQLYKTFTLNFAKKDITSKTKAAILKRARLEERVEVGASLEGVSEVTAQKILRGKEINEQVINDVMLADTEHDSKIASIIDAIKDTTPKFGTFKKPMKFKDMSPEHREMAQEQVDMMVEQFAYEVGQAEKASEKYVDVDPNSIDPSTGKVYGRSKDKIITPSTFPVDYRLAKVSGKKEVFLAAVNAYKETGKKNKLYERIEKIAAQRLIEGYESKQEGVVAPDNTYRSTVGMAKLDENRKPIESDKSFTQFAKKDGIKTGFIDIVNRNFMINIFEKGDVNTLLHETGHLWLELVRITVDGLMQKDSLNAEQIKYMKDAEAMLKQLGVTSFDEIGNDQHEAFAEMAHSYFGTGKAPSPEVESAFINFKVWVTAVFKDAMNAGIQISPEIDRFMGGLMASEMEFEIAQENYNQSDAMTDAMIQNMKPEEVGKYVAKRLEVEMKQVAELTHQFIYVKDKETKTARNKARKQMKADVTAEVNKDKRYIAVETMTSGKSNIKIGIDYITELMGYNYEINMPKGTTIVDTEQGVHPDEIAQALGFENGVELIKGLNGLQNRNAFIKEETEAQLTVAYPDVLVSDTEMQKAAADAIASEDGQIELKKMELNYWLQVETKEAKKIIKRLSSQLKTNAQYKAQAKKFVDESLVKEMIPFNHRRDQKTNNKKAAEAFAKDGDIAKMIHFKREQLKSLEKERESIKAKRYIEKTQRRFKTLKKVDPKTHDISIINGARKILSNFDLDVVNEDKLNKELKVLAENDNRKALIIRNHVDKLSMDFKPYKELTMKEYRVMAETVIALMKQAKDERSIIIDGQKVEVQKGADLIKTQLGKHKLEFEGLVQSGIRKAEQITGQFTYDNHSETRLDIIWSGLMSHWAGMRRTEHWATAADLGNKVTGPITNLIVKPIITAVDNHRVYKRKILDELALIYKTREDAGLDSGHIDGSELAQDGKSFGFKNKAELLGYLQHMGNESNLDKLLLGHGIASMNEDQTVDKTKWNNFIKEAMADGRIVEADMIFLQGLWNTTQKMLPDSQEAHFETQGRYFDTIEHTPIITDWGTFAGGYVPVVANSFYSQAERQHIDEDALFSADNFFLFPTVEKGFTLNRTGNVARINTDIDLIASHIDKVSRFINIAPAASNVAKLLNHGDVKDAINAYDKHAINKMLLPWLNRATSQRVTGKSTDSIVGLNKIAKTLRANVGIQRMAGNFVNTIQQFTGFSISLTRVSGKHLGHALMVYSQDRSGVREFINGKSNFMKERVGGQMAGMDAEFKMIMLNQNKVFQMRDKIRLNAYFMQEFTQNFVDTVTWQGAYDQAKTEGKAEKDAVWAADSAVRETQGSFNAEDISAFEAGPAFERLFTMFYSYFNMQANLMGSQFHMAIEKHGLVKAIPSIMESYFYGIMLPAFMSELLIKAMSGNFDDDEDGDYLDEFARAMFGSTLRSTFALHPATGAVGSLAMNFVLNPEWRTRDIRYSAVGSAITDTATGIGKLMDGSDVTSKQTVKGVSEGIGLILGVPTEPLHKATRYFRDMNNDDDILDMTRGILSGKASK